MKQYGQAVCFGDMPAPQLPKGFSIRRRATGVAIASNPRIKGAFIIALKPSRLVPIISIKPRQMTCDFENPIFI